MFEDEQKTSEFQERTKGGKASVFWSRNFPFVCTCGEFTCRYGEWFILQELFEFVEQKTGLSNIDWGNMWQLMDVLKCEVINKMLLTTTSNCSSVICVQNRCGNLVGLIQRIRNMSLPSWAVQKWPTSDSSRTVYDTLFDLDTYLSFLRLCGDGLHKKQARLTGGKLCTSV